MSHLAGASFEVGLSSEVSEWVMKRVKDPSKFLGINVMDLQNRPAMVATLLGETGKQNKKLKGINKFGKHRQL